MAKGKHAAALFEVIHKAKAKASEARAVEKPAPRAVVRAAEAAETSRSENGSSFNIDSDHHKISLKISFAAAGTAASALLVLVVVAFLAGRRIGANGLPAVVETTEQLRQHPPHPTVLNVARQGSSLQAQTQQQQSSPLLLTASSTDTSPAQATNGEPPAIVINPQRQPGLNYVIMQSYPDEKIANDARDALVAAGISCTVEKWAGFGHGDWFSVIGTTGFSRIRGAEYDGYIQTIQSVGSKFAGTSRFKKFEPHAYKWK